MHYIVYLMYIKHCTALGAGQIQKLNTT